MIDDEVCKGCGEKGHVRKECHQNLVCKRCHKKGHIESNCRHPSGYQVPQGPKKQPTIQQAAQGLCVPCGENTWMMSWMCDNCGISVRDDDDVGTKCPSCHTERVKEEAAPKSLLPPLKAATERDIQRAQTPDSTGALPLSPQMQDAVQEARQLEIDIAALEKMKGVEEALKTKRKELGALKPKLPTPTQALKDHSDVISAMRGLEEKRTIKDKELEERP